jgi:hypothetical protein
MMNYRRFYSWVDPQEFRGVKDSLEKKGIQLKEEARIPCRVLRPSTEIGSVAPPAWDGFCKRRTSWYRKSDKTGKFLIVSNKPFDHLDIGNPIIITESNFRPPRLPSLHELVQLIESHEFQNKKPSIWEKVGPLDKEFYRRWFERHRPDEPFDFERIFAYHSANHANFLNPKFFITEGSTKVPYSIADSIHVCSSCLEFFNILGSQWSLKYVVPCIGAVQFAHLPADMYFEVTTQHVPPSPLPAARPRPNGI